MNIFTGFIQSPDARKTLSRGCRYLGIAAALFLAAGRTGLAAEIGTPPSIGASVVPDILKGISIEEKLGASVDIDHLSFTDETGKLVRLSSFFTAKKPVVLSFAYYECPNLCGIVLNAMVDGLKGLDWVPGEKFEMVNVSINPREDFKLAAAKKKSIVEAIGKPAVANGWHFLVGAENQIKSLASQVGFGYRYDDKEQQFVHGAGIFILTPEGKVSRVLYGIQYRPSDLKLSLLEASNGKIGTVLDRIVLFCYSYDPKLRKYSMVLTRVMQAGALGTTMTLGAYLTLFWRRQRRDEDGENTGG